MEEGTDSSSVRILWQIQGQIFSNQFARAGSFCFLSRQSVTILWDGSSDAILTVKSSLG